MNAKKEFLNHVKDLGSIKCAVIILDGHEFPLKVGHNDSNYEDFLKFLDVEYNNGYGGQELFGTIWFNNGTWSEREEYDGSEWWKHRYAPAINPNLL